MITLTSKKGHYIIALIAGLCVFTSILLAIILIPTDEECKRKQIIRQHSTFVDSLLNDNGLQSYQIPPYEYIYATIQKEGNNIFNPIIHLNNDSIKLKSVRAAGNRSYDLHDKDDKEKFDYVLKQLNKGDLEYLYQRLSTQRRKELGKMARQADDSSKRHVTLITNILIGDTAGHIRLTIHDNKFEIIEHQNVPKRYISKKAIHEWLEDSIQLFEDSSVYDVLTKSNLINEINHQFVRMNFRDDELYIGDQTQHFSSSDTLNRTLQQKCLNNPIVLLSDKYEIKTFEEFTNEVFHEAPLWCTDQWLIDAKNKKLINYGIQDMETTNYDLISYILIFVLLLIFVAIMLFAYKYLTSDKTTDDDETTPKGESKTTDDDNKPGPGIVSDPTDDVSNLKKRIKKLEEAHETLLQKKQELSEENIRYTRKIETLSLKVSELTKSLNESQNNNNLLQKKDNEQATQIDILKQQNKKLTKQLEEQSSIFDKKIKDTIEEIESKYQDAITSYNKIYPYYTKTRETIERVRSYYQRISQDLKFWDRAMLMQVTLHHVLMPLLKIWDVNTDLTRQIDSILSLIRLDNLQLYVLRHMEITLKSNNVTSADFIKSVNSKIPQDIEKYNVQAEQIKIPEIKIIELNDSKYTEFSDLMKKTIAKIKLDEVFKDRLWQISGKDFAENVEVNTDKEWFFEHIITLAYYTADYLRFNQYKSTNTDYYFNLKYLETNFNQSYPDTFEYQHYEKSNSYANRIYEWCRELNIQHLKVLINKYLILP